MLVSSKASLLGLQWLSSPSVFTWSSLCVLVSSYKDTSHIGLGSILMTSFYLNYLFKGFISQYSHILRY